MSNDEWSLPNLPLAPDEYDRTFMDNVLFQIFRTLSDIQAVGSLRVGTINISDLPTSATGLRTGDLWNDTGTVKIV